jgi:hypothetical protein
MVQLHLFPPPTSPGTPLPGKVRGEVKELVASLLIVVAEANSKKQLPRRKDSHE